MAPNHAVGDLARICHTGEAEVLGRGENAGRDADSVNLLQPVGSTGFAAIRFLLVSPLRPLYPGCAARLAFTERSRSISERFRSNPQR
jgi:hypothetical protein